MAIGAIPVAVCVPESTENTDILGYKFDKKVRHNHKLCKQYSKDVPPNCEKGTYLFDTFTGTETCFLYRSLEPVKMTSIILVDENGVIESRPPSPSKGQKILCESCDDPTKTKVITT
jgi:hypothetical protein